MRSASLPHRLSWLIYAQVWGRGVLPAALPAPFSATLSPALSVYLCMSVGPQGAIRRSACPILCHSKSEPLSLSVRDCRVAGSTSGQTACPVCPTLRQSWSATATRVLSALVPVSAPPTGLAVCFFFIYFVSDFPAIRLSISSGWARRHSVSTYITILVLSP